MDATRAGPKKTKTTRKQKKKTRARKGTASKGARQRARRPAKFVYRFDEVVAAERHAGSWDGVRALLGGKGANLSEMARLRLPVPPGFVVTTEACRAFLAAGAKFPPDLWQQVKDALVDVDSMLLVVVGSGLTWAGMQLGVGPR